MASTEHIEARLAAYIEGELDPAERADIENHLANNPQHQALLAELVKMRFVVRDLPKESAPPEILDRVQQQLERHMLLDDPSGYHRPLKLHRVPSFLIAAAMVFLAIGLGIVVYYALPSRHATNPMEVAIKQESAKPVDAASATTAPSYTPAAVPAVAGPDRRLETEAAKESSAGKMGYASKGGARDNENAAKSAPGEIAPILPNAQNDLILAQSTTQPALPPTNNNTVFIVVNSTDPGGTQNELNTFFKDNNFSWNVESEAMPEPIDVEKDRDVAMSRLRQQSVQMKLGDSQNLQKQAAELQSQGGMGQQSQQPQQFAGNAGNAQRYVVRNVSRSQVTEINGVLSRGFNRASAPIELEEQARTDAGQKEKKDSEPTTTNPANSAATTQPTLAAGESLRVTVDELVGPGVEKTNTVKISEEGLLYLPMIEPIRIAGLDEEQAKTKIADAYREAQLINAPTVTLAKLAPTTQPATTQPVEQHAQQLDVSKIPTTQPANEKVDVVILVQPEVTTPLKPEAAPAVGAPPATQPANAK